LDCLDKVLCEYCEVLLQILVCEFSFHWLEDVEKR
jgi:hypothetical protein